jgi:replicative DNA helicase
MVGEQMQGWPGKITYVHCPGWTATQISADWRAFITRHRVDIVIIDYLHKVYFDVVKGRSDEMHLASIVETFKTTAEQTGIPIMLGCQINREEIKSKHEQKITLNHLRGSGQVAEKSNVVLGIWNEPLMTGSWKDGNNVVSVYVLKNTPGQLGTAHLVWIPSRLKFRDVHESVPPMNQPVVVPWYSNGNGDDVSYKVVPDVSVPEQEPVPVPVPVVIKPVVL